MQRISSFYLIFGLLGACSAGGEFAEDKPKSKLNSSADQNGGHSPEPARPALPEMRAKQASAEHAHAPEAEPVSTAEVPATPTTAPTAKPSQSPAPSSSPAAVTTRGLLTLAPEKNGTGGMIWVYTIPAGTGNKSWNADATMFELKMGETLRIKALETGHGLHTGGSPCRHGGNRQFAANGTAKNFNATAGIDVNGYFECDITQPVNTTGANANAVYDHIQGTGARIYIIAQ